LEPFHQKIEDAARESGAELVGFADLSPLNGMLAGYATTF
jgi:hypothetical protein